jgi:3-oxoacyl-[acyl-carrier protein] reductase
MLTNNLTDNLSGKIAIVTGASRGIGAAIARRLAKEGATVIVNYAGKAEEADAVVRAIGATGGRAVTTQADVSDPKAVARMFDSAEAGYGGVDILVNNAGVMKLAPIAASDDALFDSQIAINLKGSFNAMREAARRLRKEGRIINVSSSVVKRKAESYGVYVATKIAVEGLTGILSKELRGRNITVNAVAPGPIGTDLFLNGKSPEQIEMLAKMSPIERLGTPDDVANMVAFLASPEGGWVNGQVLQANGGLI